MLFYVVVFIVVLKLYPNILKKQMETHFQQSTPLIPALMRQKQEDLLWIQGQPGLQS